jgi:hypothetical protein
MDPKIEKIMEEDLIDANLLYERIMGKRYKRLEEGSVWRDSENSLTYCLCMLYLRDIKRNIKE